MPSEVSIVSGGESFDQLKRELAEAREQQAATGASHPAVEQEHSDWCDSNSSNGSGPFF